MSKQNVQPHGRIIIRKKVKELLVDKVDINRSKMFCSKPGPKFAEELPCLLIYFADEIEDTQKIVPRNYKRNLNLVVEIQIQTDATPDNFANENNLDITDSYEEIFLDSRAYEIERALGADRFLGLQGLVEDVVMLRQQPLDIDYGGEVSASCLRTFWDVQWRDAIYDNTKLDEFLNFNTKYETTEGAEAEDEVVIREE